MKTYDSAFEMVTDNKEDQELLKMRSNLMREVVDLITNKGLLQSEAAVIIGCSQPRISRLKNGRLSEFGLNWLTKAKLKLTAK